MIVFRCSFCSKVSISTEGYRCSHCEKEETRISSIPDNSVAIEVRSTANSDKDNFLHLQNAFVGADCRIRPQVKDKCNAAKLHASKEKDNTTLYANSLDISSSQEEKITLYTFSKDDINVIQLKDNQRKAYLSKLLNKNSNPTVCNDSQDNMKIIKFSIKTPILKNLFICNKCGKSFTNASKLKVHFENHFKRKCLKCEICDKKYFFEAHLKKHYKSHMDKVTFKSNLWDSVFIKNSNLSQRHKNRILEPIVETSAGQGKINKCQQREQETSEDDDPHKHFQTWAEEKIYLCSECGAKFIRELDFRAHSLRHRAQKPFNCNECHKGFRYESELNKHYDVHSQKRLFICKICNFSSTHGNNINRHLKWCQVYS